MDDQSSYDAHVHTRNHTGEKASLKPTGEGRKESKPKHGAVHLTGMASTVVQSVVRGKHPVSAQCGAWEPQSSLSSLSNRRPQAPNPLRVVSWFACVRRRVTIRRISLKRANHQITRHAL